MSNWKEDRNRIIGLGEQSFHKSYYPELEDKLEELEIAYQNLDELFSGMADAVAIHDFDGKFLYLNIKARKLLNIPDSDEVKDYSIKDISLDKIQRTEIQDILNNSDNYNSSPLEWLAKPIGIDKTLPIDVTLNKIKWYGEDALVAVIRDSTERKAIEAKLIEAKNKAVESDRLKSAFLANMSHEIRTPMNAILGFASLLKDTRVAPDKQTQYIDIIEKGGIRMLNIINDIIDISKIESGLVKLHNESYNLNEQIDYIVNLFEKDIQEKGLHLHLDIPQKLGDLEILADKEKMYAVLTNLVKNAIKYTDEGSIKLCYEIVQIHRKQFLQFTIMDTGIGIPEIRCDAIFDRFVQADIEDTMARQGAGLGLAISRAYVEMMGGKIWLESKEGKGSSFFFAIPI